MSIVNYATREITCKIVYYGPGLSGKTTNLKQIYDQVPWSKLHRKEKKTAKNGEVDGMALGARLLRAKTEAVDDGYRVAPLFARRTYSCVRLKLPWEVSEETFTDNIEGERLEKMADSDDAPVQRCFTARKGDVALRVCEQIEDAQGQHFADTSAWYWAAALGRSQGPWRAVTVTRALSS